MMSESFAPLLPDKIDSFERNTGIALPDEYRAFLLTTNGGIPKFSQFQISEISEAALVDIFYGINDTRVPCDLEHEFNDLGEKLPSGLLPIGHDPGGNILLLGTTGNRRGHVYYWDSAIFFPSSSEQKNVYFLANSFTEFIEQLR